MTETPTPTAFFFWPTPTPWDTPDAQYVLTVPPVNPIFVQAAEQTVQVYNEANRFELIDNLITLLLVVMILGAGVYFYRKMRRMGGNDD